MLRKSFSILALSICIPSLGFSEPLFSQPDCIKELWGRKDIPTANNFPRVSAILGKHNLSILDMRSIGDVPATGGDSRNTDVMAQAIPLEILSLTRRALKQSACLNAPIAYPEGTSQVTLRPVIRERFVAQTEEGIIFGFDRVSNLPNSVFDTHISKKLTWFDAPILMHCERPLNPLRDFKEEQYCYLSIQTPDAMDIRVQLLVGRIPAFGENTLWPPLSVFSEADWQTRLDALESIVRFTLEYQRK